METNQAPSMYNVIETLKAMTTSEERVSYLKENHINNTGLKLVLRSFYSHQANFFASSMEPAPEDAPAEVCEHIDTVTQSIAKSGISVDEDFALGLFLATANQNSIGDFHRGLGVLHHVFTTENRSDLIDYTNRLLTRGLETGLTHDDLIEVWPSFFEHSLTITPMMPCRTTESLPFSVNNPMFADSIRGERLIAFVTWANDRSVVALRYPSGEKVNHNPIENEIASFADKVKEKYSYPDGFILDGYVRGLHEDNTEYDIIDMLDSLTKFRTGIDKRRLIDRRIPLVLMDGDYVKEADHMIVDDVGDLSLIEGFLDNPKRVLLRNTDSIYEADETDLATMVIL